MGSGGRTGKRDRTHGDSGAWRRDRLLVMNITFARLGKAGRNTTLKISDDFWRRVTVEGGMGWRGDEREMREEKEEYLHQVLASGSSIAGSTLRKLTLRMKP